MYARKGQWLRPSMLRSDGAHLGKMSRSTMSSIRDLGGRARFSNLSMTTTAMLKAYIQAGNTPDSHSWRSTLSKMTPRLVRWAREATLSGLCCSMTLCTVHKVLEVVTKVAKIANGMVVEDVTQAVEVQTCSISMQALRP